MHHHCARGFVLIVLLAAACSDGSNTSGDAAITGASGSTAGAAAGQGATAGQGTTATAGSAPRAGTGGVAGAVDAGVTPAAGSGGAPVAAGSGAAGAPGTAGAAAGSGAPTAGGGATAGGPAPAPGTCDRACLLGVMQTYLDALVAKDPSKLKVSATMKYTENGVVSKLGDTIWKTATALMPMARLDFADPMTNNVASQVVVNEGTAPVIYQVRLKVVNMEITEIESMAVRRSGAANGFFNAAKMVPEPVFLQAIDPAKRMTRDAMNTLMETYLDYLEGKKRGSEVAFDTNCKRYENGQATATGISSFESQSWGFQVTRRTLIIDEEAGITWGMYPFSQSATALVVGEAFKMIDGKFMMIQAVMANQPAKVWDMTTP
jgi:hypothetical protein